MTLILLGSTAFGPGFRICPDSRTGRIAKHTARSKQKKRAKTRGLQTVFI